MVTTTIDLVRHAQTTYGAESRYAGSHDCDLSPKGIADTQKARRNLHRDSYDAVLSSPLVRARRTAQLLVPDAPLEIDERMVERNFGKLEGRTYAEVDQFDPPILFIEVGGDRHSVNPPGAEPFENVWFRARQVAADLLTRHAGDRVMLVAHSVFIQMLTGVLTGLSCIEALAIKPRNLELSRFVLDDGDLVGFSSDSLIGETAVGF